MFEKKIAKEVLKTLGIIEPTQLDTTRFIERFKIDKLSMSKKLGMFVVVPAFRKFLDVKLDGVLDDDK